MWVTSRRSLEDPAAIFWSYPHLNISQNNAFRSVVILTMMHLKTEKRPILITNRFSLQAGIKPP